ncbi:Spliceosome-associated protein CWC15 homolog [Linum perenne]
MTTAARLTWAPAKGGNEQGGCSRVFGASQKFSSRDLAAHTTLKPRREGQDTQDELEKRNLRKELEERERRHFSSKDKSYSGSRRDVEDRIIPCSVDADDSDGETNTNDERCYSSCFVYNLQ